MKKTYVLPFSHLPIRSPLLLSAVLYMALDLYFAPGWLWGVSCTLIAILWVGYVFALYVQTEKPLPGYGKRDE